MYDFICITLLIVLGILLTIALQTANASTLSTYCHFEGNQQICNTFTYDQQSRTSNTSTTYETYQDDGSSVTNQYQN